MYIAFYNCSLCACWLSTVLTLELGLNYYNGPNPCLHCPCNMTTLPWRDLSVTAKWLDECWSNDGWQRAHRRTMHPIFELWSVTIQSVVTDILHVKHLGVDGNLAGSVLYMLCFMMMDGFRGVEPSLPDIVCNA